MAITGRVILITGASRGIGAAAALHLAKEGARVALTARNGSALEAVKEACEAAGGEAALFPGDMTDTAFLKALPTQVVETFGRLDALFNNAGLVARAPADEADLAEWDRVLDVNFRAWMHLTRHALPHLTANPESAVINLCSVAGRHTYATGGIYSATKHAVHAWSGCLFEDLRAKGVKVCALYPGFVNTEMVTDVPGDKDKMIQPGDIARAIEFVLTFPSNACPTEIVIRPQYPST